ncbi:MAG: enoyl-CoA hydratase [Halioglobus sp.]|jgi:enoyl-CoA hydratase|uniref:enoyl-CoA hydratase n=1 Tax=Halioglobus sp. Uisw_031 TaxID=3230977 RepID=UPI003590DF7F
MTELLLQREDGYAVLTLNRPDARNALSPQLLLDLCDAFRLLQDESDIYSVILTGAGTAFCAGLDLKAMAEDESGLGVYAIHAQHDITAAMTAFDRPIIVGVNGVAATGGFELALMGDILLASSGARFADTHCRVGLAPGWGLSQKLARIIGPSRAREAHFTGNVISAQQAEAWGLVSRVVAPEDLLDACRQVATDIASCVPETVKVYKKMVNEGLQTDLAAGLAMERSVMTDVNQRVSGDVIANRRSGVQQRGKNQ